MKQYLYLPPWLPSLACGLLMGIQSEAAIYLQAGDILLANYGKNSLLRIDPGTSTISKLADFLVPMDVALYGADIFVSESNGRVQRFNINSETKSVVNPVSHANLEDLGGITVGPAGDLYVSGREQKVGGGGAYGIYKINPSTGDTSLISSGGLFSSALRGIEFLDPDHLVVASPLNNQVISVALDGGAQTALADPDGVLDQPWGLGVRGGDLYVTCIDGSKIMKISGGNITEVRAGLDASPYGLGLESNGDILAGISGVGGKAVAHISPSGDLLPGFSGGDIDWVTGIDVVASSVPEPKAWGGILGLIAVAFAGLKRSGKLGSFFHS